MAPPEDRRYAAIVIVKIIIFTYMSFSQSTTSSSSLIGASVTSPTTSTKIIVIGESGAGKSSILLRFTDDVYSDRPVSTIGQDYKTRALSVEDVDWLGSSGSTSSTSSAGSSSSTASSTASLSNPPVKNKKKSGGGKSKKNRQPTCVRVEVWDTAGQERFRTITSSFFRNAEGALVVFDLTNRKSFRRLKNWFAELKRFSPAETARVVVGNKVDLGDDQRAVHEDEVREFCSLNGVHYVETSAKTGRGVDRAFETIVREVLRRQGKGRGGREKFEIGGRSGSVSLAPVRASCCCDG